MSFGDKIERTIRRNLDNYQHRFYIYYQTKTTCDSCGGVDSVFNESFNPACSTCGGTGYVYTNTVYGVNGVVKKFIGSEFISEAQDRYNIYPEGIARVTSFLEDVLVNPNSAEGLTYYDDCDRVRVDHNDYQVKSVNRVNYGSVYLCEAVLERIKRE